MATHMTTQMLVGVVIWVDIRGAVVSWCCQMDCHLGCHLVLSFGIVTWCCHLVLHIVFVI
jgi:hypothetical protein